MNSPAPFHIPEHFGIDRLHSNLQALVNLGQTMIRNAPQGALEPRCAWDDSGLSLASEHELPPTDVSLLIDIGGSHTKVALIGLDQKIRILFDHPNEWFKPTRFSSKRPIESFFSQLSQTISESVALRTHVDTPLRIGLIWSNQLQSHPFHSETTQGTTGVVSGKDLGSYRKGEWFLDGLRNGEDLGRLFLASLAENQISCSVLVIGNDTVCTLFATANAHAGIVVSSGANCTLVGQGSRGESTILNSELGGLLMIPSELLSKGDVLYANTFSHGDVAFEELCAGKWFAGVVSAHIQALAQEPEGDLLKPLSNTLTTKDIQLTNELISDLLRQPIGSIKELGSLSYASLSALQVLAQALVNRAGMLAGVLCFLSVSNQKLTSLKSITASLDSSLARHLPGFFTSASKTFTSLLPSGVVGSLALVKPIDIGPGAELTPPMIGLARALKQYKTTSQGSYVRAACAK
jgi:hypothetical protein